MQTTVKEDWIPAMYELFQISSFTEDKELLDYWNKIMELPEGTKIPEKLQDELMAFVQRRLPVQ